ncbi:putative quinol monooxygenase [Tanticharoenia sakaeratensis]|uniref:ABM domain-containing protein n=1 Tax=Tanticharoenia sakaeratensis NBRC 103193 TaxID=1231623 RepID=A0A0D6MN81_9PROT|nr:antibiotic biosynthesis monooxygenase [Tanticharoenia sakaeratensis]GAN54855.1 hypothetical protein Tasa_031_073 [Tanticharoenia sakaeratensis NBRC 103193]GBQ21362.1 hypothetical protein AA103193_1701 [Tanticharoenia sakaeratensis NBRC 103193]
MTVELNAVIEVPEELAGEAELAIVRSVAHARTHPGCQFYAGYRDRDQMGRFVLIERWASIEMLDAHGLTEPSRAFRRSLRDFGAVTRITRLDPMG